jgi:hypothetical protein
MVTELHTYRWALAASEQIATLEASFHGFVASVIDSAGVTRGPVAEGLRAEACALFLAISVCHLGTAILADPRLVRHYDEPIFEAARTLRNIFEHWDETRQEFQAPDSEATRSVRSYKRRHPGMTPWSLGGSPNGIVVGSILPLRPLATLVEAIQADLDAEVGAAIARMADLAMTDRLS